MKGIKEGRDKKLGEIVDFEAKERVAFV